MPKRPVKKQIKFYSYRRKDGRLIRVPTHPRTYYIGKIKEIKESEEIKEIKKSEITKEISEIDKEINKQKDALISSKKLYSTKYFEEVIKPNIERSLIKLSKRKQELLINLIKIKKE